MGEFGDFEEIADEKNEKESRKQQEQSEEQQNVRARVPRGSEIIGVIIQRLGGNRMEVKTTKGKILNCRVPGRYKRKLWLRPKDYVLVVPWADNPEKADVIYKYRPGEINQLRKKGVLVMIDNEF